jgi:cell division initiation protein
MLKSDEQTQSTEILGSPKPAGEGGRRLPSPDRNLTVTPLDLRQAKFNSAMRGFDRAEVTAFLLEAADGYEQALRENDRLRQDVARLESSLTQYRDLESSIKSTLMTAQRTADSVRENAQQAADDMRDNATQEAARLVREAEGRADLLMQKTQARVEDVQRDIDTLRMKRREAESNLESIIAAMQNTITFVREQEQREHRVVPHRPREVAAQSA